MSCSKLKLYGSLLSLALITVAFQQCAPAHQFSSIEPVTPEKAMNVGGDVPGSNEGPQSFDDDSNNPSDDVASNPPPQNSSNSDEDMSIPPSDSNPPSTSSNPPSNSTPPSGDSPNQDVADNDDSTDDSDSDDSSDPKGPQNAIGRTDDGDASSGNDPHVCNDEQGNLHPCVVVCHIPPGNPAQQKEMFRSDVWVEKHLKGAHAASMPFRIGPCEQNI